ncbi:MAG: GNAT family N-acetyltransferase [Novosphingobium sp.]|nr:GNAT family N-acetyltransferase [Novosphingobium sp.]
MFVRTENLLLRPSWPDDIDELVDLLNDDAVRANLAVKPWPDTREAARLMISRPREDRLPSLFIYIRSDEGMKLIGGIGFGRDGKDVELGYWIARSHWGHGYATEAVRAMLDQAWMLGHERIIATHFADNVESGKVLEKAGFEPTSETRMRFSYGRGGEAPAVTFVAMSPYRKARIEQPSVGQSPIA